MDVPEALSGLAARGEAGAAGGGASVPEAGAAAGAPCVAGVRVPPRVARTVTARHTCLPSVAPGTSVPPQREYDRVHEG